MVRTSGYDLIDQLFHKTIRRHHHHQQQEIFFSTLASIDCFHKTSYDQRKYLALNHFIN